MAETLDGSFLGAEMASTPQGQGDPVLPEDLGKSCAMRLLEEVHRVGAAKDTHTHTHRVWTVPVAEPLPEEKVKTCSLPPVGRVKHRDKDYLAQMRLEGILLKYIF